MLHLGIAILDPRGEQREGFIDSSGAVSVGWSHLGRIVFEMSQFVSNLGLISWNGFIEIKIIIIKLYWNERVPLVEEGLEYNWEESEGEQ